MFWFSFFIVWLSVDQSKGMLGTFAPQREPYEHTLDEETTPSGVLARGIYSAKLKVSLSACNYQGPPCFNQDCHIYWFNFSFYHHLFNLLIGKANYIYTHFYSMLSIVGMFDIYIADIFEIAKSCQYLLIDIWNKWLS